MAVFKRKVRGKKLWIIGRRFRGLCGGERYRRRAQVQTRLGAENEERRVAAYWAEHGTIAPLLVPAVQHPSSTKENKKPIWEDAVEYYCKEVLPSLEASTRRGYLALLKGPGLKSWAGVELETVIGAEIIKWNTALKKTGIASSTLRNHHIILRSVLKSVGPLGGESGVMLNKLPYFPPMPKVGKTEVEPVAPEDIGLLLGPRPKGFHFKVWELFQLAVALSAFAGLRASEIRALRFRDVDLKTRTITVRLKRCAGEEGKPKSQHQRTIDFIASALFERLEARCQGLKYDDYVCPNSRGNPWGDSALWTMFKRTCKALKIEDRRYHGLRHAFATALFEGNVDARTAQELLGHGDLATSTRYAHTTRDRKRAAGKVFEEQLRKDAD